MILSTFIICRSDDSLRIVFSLICTLYSQAASLQERHEINQAQESIPVGVLEAFLIPGTPSPQ